MASSDSKLLRIADTNTMRLPSGVNFGEEAEIGIDVIRRASPPSVGIT